MPELDNREMVEFLLSHGADVNSKTNKGETPLKIAIKNNRKEVANLLRKHGGVK